VTLLLLRSAAQIADRPSAVQQAPPGLARSPGPGQAPGLALPPRRPDYVPDGLGGQGRQPRDIDAYLDRETKRQTRTAPLAVFVLVVLIVLVYLATR